RAKYLVFSFIFGLPLLTFLIWWFALRGVNQVDTSLPTSFDATSDKLERTVIVPTLDTPMPADKNVIWCASFQLAWNKVKTDLAGGPVQIQNAEALAKSLNDAPQSEGDLPPGSFYAAAGWDRDGILDTIRKDMARLFPGVRVSDLPQDPSGATAFAYLQTSVRFDFPFFEEPNGFRFSNGKTVSGFGLTHEHEGAYRRLRDQVEVLYAASERENEFNLTSYALDLCKNSQPNQLVLACIKPGKTLEETLTHLQAKIASTLKDAKGSGLFIDANLRVPNTHWRISHRFAGLEGPDKPLLNPSLQGLYIDLAQQII